MLPLDLHVLGLPLAFILSQDQTLHCLSLNIYSTPLNNTQVLDIKMVLCYSLLRCLYNMSNELLKSKKEKKWPL